MKAILFSVCVLAGAMSLAQQSSADPRAARPATNSKPEVTGVIPRAIRGGDPFEMIDPFAPVKYGTAEQNVVFEPEQPDRGGGIKLVRVSF
jgi:hypothetical protein